MLVRTQARLKMIQDCSARCSLFRFRFWSRDFAFVIADDEGVCGYLLGTPDTARFYRRMETEWLPRWRGLVSDPGHERKQWRGSDWLRHEIHHPRLTFPPILHPYPAQAHIDMLPRARGKGVGRKAMQHLMLTLAAAGAGGIHLQVNPRNLKAQRFYASLDFRRVNDANLRGRYSIHVEGPAVSNSSPHDKSHCWFAETPSCR